MSPAREPIPIACTLEPSALPDRLDAWRSVLAGATSREELPDGGRRVEFADGVDVTELAGLVAAEQSCCAFFAFALTVDHRGIGLEVRAPEDAAPLIDALFGQ